MSVRTHWNRFWADRTPRERHTLAFGAIALVLLGAYGLYWRPIAADLVRMEEQLPRLQAQVAQVERVGAELVRLRSQPPRPAADGAQLPAIIARSAEQSGLTKGQYTPDPSARHTKAVFDGIPFESWTAWIDQLHRIHRIALVAARIQALPTPGIVRIECEFIAQDPTR